MKNKINSSLFVRSCIILFAFVLLSVIHSCHKDLSTRRDTTITDPDVIQAKEWFDAIYPTTFSSNVVGNKVQTQSVGASGGNQGQFYRPDWQHTRKYNRFNKNVIEMPVDPEGKMTSVLRNANSNKAYSSQAYSKSYYLFLKDETGYQAYVMIIIADSNYVKNDLSKLSRNTYSKRDADFSGVVLYFTPDGNYINGYSYKNGHLLKASSASQPTSTLNVQSSSGKKATGVVTCTDWYADTFVNGYLVEAKYIATTCTNEETGGGGGDNGDTGSSEGNNGGDVGGGSGGGDSSNSPVYTPTLPTAPPCSTPSTNAIENPGNHLAVTELGDEPVNDGDGSGFPPPVICTAKAVAQILIDDSLKKNFPCLISLIINKLSNVQSYANMIQPFTTTLKPNLKWQNGLLPWDTQIPNSTAKNFEAGVTSKEWRNATITLNTQLLQNSSQLLIASVAIHETLHAYINYQIQTNITFTPSDAYNGTKSWMVSLDYWVYQNGLPGNYHDHFDMLNDYFDKAVGILKTWDNSGHTDKEYREAMLFGLDHDDLLVLPAGNPASLSTEFNAIKTKYNITTSDLENFNRNNLNSSADKLPTGCN